MAGFGIFQGDPEDKLQGLIQILGLAENLANFIDDLDLEFFKVSIYALKARNMPIMVLIINGWLLLIYFIIVSVSRLRPRSL